VATEPTVRLMPTEPDLAPVGQPAAPALSVEEIRDRPEAGRLVSADAAVGPLLLSADQAAALCGVSPATWYRMGSAGRCPSPVRLSRGCVRWRAEELRDWIAAGCPSRREWEARRDAVSGNNRPR
jgi:predicted DNA-binding transcriptional regulator AlpA